MEPAIATICVGNLTDRQALLFVNFIDLLTTKLIQFKSGIVQVLASGCTPLIVDRLGRKIILLVSAAGMAISLGFLGLFFYLDHQKAEIVSSLSWLPIVSLVGFVIVYCVGFGPLPWAVFGELSRFKFKLKLNFYSFNR